MVTTPHVPRGLCDEVAEMDALKRRRAETVELNALPLSILDKAFRGEL